MIGAGIFALFAAAGAVAGPATWIAFLVGGIVAVLLVSASRSSSAGGVVAALTEGFGTGRIAGVASWIVYAAAVVTVMATVAGVFGSYAAALAGGGSHVFTTALVLAVVAVNWTGVGVGHRVRWLVSAGVLVVLAAFVAGTLARADWSKLSATGYPSVGSIVAAVALTCFAYLAFAGAGGRSGGAATGLYALVAAGVFGTLTVAQVDGTASRRSRRPHGRRSATQASSRSRWPRLSPRPLLRTPR